MSYNANREYCKLTKIAETNTNKYKKLGMSDEAIKELNEFDLDMYKSDRRFYSHIVDLPDKTAEEIADEVPTYDTYFFESEDSYEFVEDKRLKGIIEKAGEKEKHLLSLIVMGYTNAEISRMLKISMSGISKMLYRMKTGVS